jgi:hypothetical protein
MRQVTGTKPGQDQVQAAEMMVSVNNYSIPYANALLVTTPAQGLVSSSDGDDFIKVSPRQKRRITSELEQLQSRISSVESSYGSNHLNLAIVRNFVAVLLGNPKILLFMAAKYPEILAEFHQISGADSLSSRRMDGNTEIR